eukprot:15175682-Ditylum_brightwellii.AAC.1
MVKENSGQESTDNVEAWRDDHLASSFPEPSKEGNTKENFEEDNAGSKVHGSDGDVASSLSEAEEGENMMEKGGDNAVPEVHEKSSRVKSNIVEELGSDSPKASDCDNLNVSQ